MQAIEHVHGYTCSAWYRQRLVECNKSSWQEHEADLAGIFSTKVTAENVTENVRKLWTLLQWVVQDGTGGYAPQSMT